MGYAVVVERLMDIDVFIRRGIVYGAITLVMTTILSLALFAALAFPASFRYRAKATVSPGGGLVGYYTLRPDKKMGRDTGRQALL